MAVEVARNIIITNPIRTGTIKRMPRRYRSRKICPAPGKTRPERKVALTARFIDHSFG